MQKMVYVLIGIGLLGFCLSFIAVIFGDRTPSK